MADPVREPRHRCRPETGAIEGMVFFSSKSRSWVMTVLPPSEPRRQQRVDVRFCPWCGRDLHGTVPAADASLLE